MKGLTGKCNNTLKKWMRSQYASGKHSILCFVFVDFNAIKRDRLKKSVLFLVIVLSVLLLVIVFSVLFLVIVLAVLLLVIVLSVLLLVIVLSVLQRKLKIGKTGDKLVIILKIEQHTPH
jgi:Flp pilus assembly protein TadB